MADSDFRLLRLRSQAWLYFFAVLGDLGAKTLISFLDQLAVETALTGAGFVAGSKQDSASLRIEGEGHSPLATLKRSSFMIQDAEPWFNLISQLNDLVCLQNVP
jgi:hypothetical protein